MGKKTDPTFILNADNTVTSDMCIAKKHDGARCTHRSVLTAPAMVQGSAAYSPTRIPSLRDFFRAFEIPLCKQHYNCLVSSRFGIDVINFITPETDIVNNNVQEDTMDTTYTTNHMFPGISLDALISRAADMWGDQAEYVRDFYRCEDPTEDYPKWFKDYTNRIRRLNLVIDNRQFIEFWMKNPIFPNVPKEDIMNQPIIPTRLCCGQKHLGDVCPDGTIMCGICFGKFTAEQWDNECGCCKECAIKEKDFEFRLTNGMCTCIVNANGEISSPHYTCTHHQDLYDQYIANGHQMPITSKEDNMNIPNIRLIHTCPDLPLISVIRCEGDNWAMGTVEFFGTKENGAQMHMHIYQKDLADALQVYTEIEHKIPETVVTFSYGFNYADDPNPYMSLKEYVDQLTDAEYSHVDHISIKKAEQERGRIQASDEDIKLYGDPNDICPICFVDKDQDSSMHDHKIVFPEYYNVPKEDTMNTNQTIPTYGPEMDDINAPFVTASEIRINNERIENNFPKSWPELEGDLTKHPGYAKCSTCSKEIGEDWFHPVHLIRTCLGAATPMSGFNKVLNPETLNYDYVSPSGYKTIFDTSREAIIAIAKDLAKKGCTNVKVGKSTKGKKNWYVSYRES